MVEVEQLFNRLDAWRHLPSYQLERRADVFFSLYLPEVLREKLGIRFRSELVPEFPVLVKAIDPDEPTNKSFKIDYLAVSEDGETAVLVELKTDQASRRQGQDEYLIGAQAAGMHQLLEGVLDLFRATKSKRKYYCLLELLESVGLLRIPQELKNIVARASLQGATQASTKIEITSAVESCIAMYVQPRGSGPNVIDFAEFSAAVARHDGPLSQRFAQSLRTWASVVAGERATGGGGA